MGRPIAPLLLFVAAAALLLPPAFTGEFPLGTQFAPGAVPVVSAEPLFEQATISSAAEGILHAPALLELASGERIATWFQGSREGADDVGLYLGRHLDGAWQDPVRLTDPWATGRELGRYINTLGNSVLLQRPDGEIWLIYVSVSLGGWATSQLNLKRSGDGGATWSAAERLVTSPFFNLSTLVKTPPIDFADGSVGVPVYHEMAGKFPELLVLDPAGAVIDKRRMGSGGRAAIQPALALLSEQRALALMRPVGDEPRLFASRTEDGGVTWTPVRATDIPNPGGPVGLLRLEGNTLILAFNNDPDQELDLTLALSEDAGASWRRLTAVAGPRRRGEGSITYPYLTRGADGVMHLVYADRSTRAIRHIRFNRPWLQGLAADL